jgi:predicted O-methyltransferase YrrM
VFGWTASAFALGGVGLLVWLVVTSRRRESRERELERAELQALHWLHAFLPLRLPLPSLVGWAATPRLAAELASIIFERRPARVVELGSGASTIVAGYALERNEHGSVVSIDHDAAFAAETSARLEAHALSRAVVRHAALELQDVDGARRRWYARSALDDLRDIDLLVIDGPPGKLGRDARATAFSVLGPRLSPGATVLVDDAHRPDERRAVERFVASRPGVRVRLVDSSKGIAILTLPPE